MDTDEHPRPDVTLESLGKLPTVFKKGGTVTAGNASVSPLCVCVCACVRVCVRCVLEGIFNKISMQGNELQLANGQGSHWLIESPNNNCSSNFTPPLSDICRFYYF